jgi:hypothetical protein
MMDSLFARRRSTGLHFLTLPAYCVPVDEAESLRTKREAQMQWMRKQGVRYLVGDPVRRPDPVATPSEVNSFGERFCIVAQTPRDRGLERRQRSDRRVRHSSN